MNIIHLCCIYLFKSFLDQVKGFPELKNLTIEDYDLKAYVGLERTNDIKSSIIRFINADSLNAKLYQLQPFDKQYDSFPKFQSVLSVMRHLRNEYERRIYANNSVMGVQYYLPYGELFSRYSGRANLMKWIDILCDRGVFVTRNINFNGVYCRACRSGEADFDHIERKTSILLPIIINACGKRAGDVYRIGATLLNKIIANLAYDYPKDTYDFHNFFTKPYLYGPFTYVANELNDEVVTSLYNVERISKYCLYDEKNKEFVAVAQEYISKDIQAFSQYDMVPFTEITNYVDCLHQISIKFNKADILNQLAICREEDVYYRHVHFDLFTAYNNIVTAYRTQKPEKAERYLRDAAKVANEAAKKLNYNQNELFKSLEETIGADIRYHVAYHKFLESRVEFSVSFTRFLGRLKEIAHIEQVLVNLMLYRNTYNRKYFLKLYKIEDSDKLFDKGITKELKALFDDMQVHANQTDAFLAALDAAIQQLFGKLDIAVKGLPKPNETKYVRAEQKRNIDFAINRSILYIKKKGLPRYALLHFEFSGYRNTEGSKSTNVIERVQQAMEFLTKDAENSLILCGLTGELTCGTVLFDKIEDAVQFAMKIQQLFVEENLDQVEFRFGCSSLKTLPVNSIHTNIKAAWDAAVECSSVRNCNSHFVITGSTYNLLSETTRRSFRMVTSTQGSPEKVYYGSQDFISFDSSQVVCYEENTDDSVEIGIITALTEEFVAVQKMLIEPKTAIFPKPSSAKKTTGREFCVGKVRSVDGKFHRIALTQTIGMGNMSAAVRADSLIEHFPKLDTIIMVGIAGGIPSPCDLNKHVRLGDIVLAESIIQYDFVADKRSIKELRGRDVPPCARLVEAQNALKCGMLMGNRPWESYIDEVCSVIPQFSRPAAETDVLYDARNNVIPHPEDPERTLYPKVFETKIACANRVLKNPKKRDQLMHNYDVHAVEMESGGVADATWEAQIGYYVIRGICDYCDTHKDDQWHNYAALVAAAYARSLIERIPY